MFLPPSSEFWSNLGSLVTVAAALGEIARRMLRSVIRNELAPLRQDIAVLRVAVFNHMQHGEAVPPENEIRAVLGLASRGESDAR